ncbi:MAG: multidrug transporter AcrB [Rhodomicrobium sp.]|nr:MAG: multidrug transporter AcrB [Rhodomicrobium sp.]
MTETASSASDKSEDATGHKVEGDIAALSVRRPYLAVVINLLIVIAGMGALFGIEVRELPDIDRPIVTVRANYPGGSPETIDAEITSVIEAAVARVNGVKAVRSSSEENNLRIRIEFTPKVNLIDAANDIREAVSRVERQLPDGVEDIFVVKADADARPIIQLAAESQTLSIDELTRRVEDEIVPAITSVDGVAEVNLFGDRERVLRVSLNPLKLASYQLAVADVVKVLENARYDVPAGSFKSGDQEVIVRANASVTSPQEIENLILRDPVRLKDVASASFGPAEAENYTRLNGRTVVNMGIIRQAESNTVSISRDVKTVIARLSERYKDIKISTISDDAKFIEGSIYEVLISLLLAIVIVVAVIAFFIGQMRAAFIPAVTIPIALTGTLAAIWLMGFSLNLVTLLALVLATGLVVDDAIVVLENIQRLRSHGIGPRAAAVLGTRQVFFAVIATTATLISVFLPISFLPSTAGRLFTEFGFVLAITVAISSFVALSLCPMLASRLPYTELEQQTRLARFVYWAGEKVNKIYTGLLSRIIAMPVLIFSASIIIAMLGAITYTTLGEELVPEEDRGTVTVRLVGPDGTGIDYADRQVAAVENILKPMADKGVIKEIFTISGRWDPNRGWIEAPLADWSKRSISEGEIINSIKKSLSEIPGSQARAIRGNSLGLRGSGGGIKFALTGANYDQIAIAADDLVRAMEKDLKEADNFRVEYRATQPQLAVNIDRRRASDLGVAIEDLATTVRVLVDNDEVAELTINDKIVPVLLEAKPGVVNDPSDLRNLFVRTADNRMVPLSQLVTFKEYAVAAELDRHGQRRAIEISADPTGDYSLREVITAIQKIAETTLPPGINMLLLDEAAALNETSSGTMITFFIAFVVVFLVLTAQFESPGSAAVVILTVPFGICAAIFALALTGTSINIYSQIGVLMLIGIMAKNSILMVEFADQLRDEGYSVDDAAREASSVRLRPILMTMLSTVLAGLPLIIGTGPGAESRAAIGWVVFGGLGLAGIFTLFLTPALYVVIARLSKPRADASDQLGKELSQAEGPLKSLKSH